MLEEVGNHLARWSSFGEAGAALGAEKGGGHRHGEEKKTGERESFYEMGSNE